MRQHESKIGELCRNGRTVYYASMWGDIVEREDRDELCRLLNRWASRDRTGDYCEDVHTI